MSNTNKVDTAENLYKKSKTRISKKEWTELNTFFVSIDCPAQNELYASGDHYTLALRLRKIGFRPADNAIDIYELAEVFLLAGWEGDGRTHQ